MLNTLIEMITYRNGFPYIKHQTEPISDSEIVDRSFDFYNRMNRRRTVRDFSDKPVPKTCIENILLTAGTAPSGAHKQPWTFCVVSNAELKKQIRIAAEAEEKLSYESRMSDEWLNELAPLGTDYHKPFLETAPYLIVVFRKSFEIISGKKSLTYYSQESVGIACGFLLAAIHNAGLVALTHTPSPMNFLSKLLKRPANEKPFLLIPVGYPADECLVPHLKRKELNEISVWY